MSRLALFLLGPPRLERDGVPLRFDTRKILALVAYLAVSRLRNEGAGFTRESLVALLWPELEPSRARAILRRNLSLLRSALEGEGLAVDGQMVGIDPQADLWLDVAEFQRLVRAWEGHAHPREEVCPRCLEDLEAAAALYRGDFMAGYGLRDSAAYDDWQFFQAEELRRDLASALERLARGHSARGSQDSALLHARRWLSLDPLHEPAHRLLMELYARDGQRSAALRQYQECARILEVELGLGPSPETTALYEEIRTRPAAEPGPPPALVPETRDARPARHNLPAQPTPFVGRRGEMAEIQDLLNDPGCRLLTLLGPGGIGKTRLALQVAAELAEASPPGYRHGVFFVSLTPFETAEAVVSAVAEALGYSFHADAEGRTRAAPRAQLLDYVRQRQLLLVLDNFEHLLADGSDSLGFLTGLLAAAPGVKLLVTSRASLKVQGEHVYPLAGLRVPPELSARTAVADAEEALHGYSAVELFLQGARQVRPGFEMGDADLPHVAHICRLVEGMPLGLLLAAAWIEVLTPAEIAAEIQRSLDFLETGLRDVPERQRSIRAVFDHSWRLLDEREREVFAALSVFRRGFTREAAWEVCGAELRDLMSLVTKSLVIAPIPGRYELHELLRQYAAERLDQVAERGQAVRDAHSAHYCAELERWAVELRGAGQQQAMRELDLEIENGRAAWHWAVTRRHVAHLARAVDGIWLYHTWRLRHEEGEAAIGPAATSLEGMDSAEARRLRARLLILWSHFQVEMGRKRPALRAARQGTGLLRDLEQEGHDVRSELALAVIHRARLERYFDPNPLRAKRSYEEAVARYEEVGDRWGLARALAYLGWIAEHLGQYDKARRLCERSRAIRQQLGDRRGMADAMVSLGVICWVQGHLDEAEGLLRESLGIFRELDDWSRVAHAIKSLGEVLVRRGQFENGLALLESSSAIYDDLGQSYGVATLILFLAEARVHMGRYDEARDDALRGATITHENKHRWGEGFALLTNGMVALVRGHGSDALATLQAAADIFSEIKHPENRAWVLGPLGLAALRASNSALAQQSVLHALQTGVDLGAFMAVMYALPAAALLLAEEGAVERAVEVYACASRYGFVANSRWFHDVVERSLAAHVTRLPAETAAAARARGQSQDWKAMAASLLPDF